MNESALRPSRRVILAMGTGLAGWVAAAGLGWSQSTSAPAKIGIIGSGKIGGTLGTLWVKAGHQVLFSSRHPDELKDLVAGLGSAARAGTPEEAIAFGDAILLAVPYKAYPQLGQEQAKALAGKIVLDAGNATVARDGQELVNEVQQNGIGITSAKYFPGAKIVRAFNTLGYTVLAREAQKEGARIAIPIAGDDKDALAAAAALVRDAGFDPVVVGGLDRAKEFQMGAPGYGQIVPAPELKKRLGLSG
ncbi:MAG: 8-hydroxy-5-deazaflavin:NADPH oxidoreductase [Methylobacteriaceae bacterium]|jgi:predicted dinucleotide-binding enzyme|nr:8-hydroxy-5-deazaflavin:NADPH oxidoreductase [Methylobacteriaceae bacterium]